MTLLIRRIIYISLIVFFLAATPLVLAYSLGYSYDWQNKKITQTGGFYLKSYPSGVKIFLNDKANNKTPRLISRLVPRDYRINISKDGFHSWEKQLSINAQAVTEARNILLIPKNPEVELAQENLSLDFSLNFYFLRETEAKLLEQMNSTVKNILKADSYAFAGENIFYLLPSEYILYQTNTINIEKKQISLEPLPADIYKIGISPTQNFIFALGRSGRLYLLDTNEKIFRLLEIGVKNAEFSPDNKKLLYYTDSELSIIYLEKILIQPYKEAREKELITRFAEKIIAAIWYPEDNEHIIFVVGNTIKIAELDGRGQRNTIDFLEVKNFFPDNWSNPQIFYNTKKELLYFIDDNQLYTAQIKVPQPIIETNNWFYGK